MRQGRVERKRRKKLIAKGITDEAMLDRLSTGGDPASKGAIKIKRSQMRAVLVATGKWPPLPPGEQDKRPAEHLIPWRGDVLAILRTKKTPVVKLDKEGSVAKPPGPTPPAVPPAAPLHPAQKGKGEEAEAVQRPHR